MPTPTPIQLDLRRDLPKVREAAHTPGPWKHEPIYRGAELIRNSIIDPNRVEIVYDVNSDENAPLIAEAPGLYEALEKAAARFREYAQMHRAKADEMPDAMNHVQHAEHLSRCKKATSNREMAELCEAALSRARGES